MNKTVDATTPADAGPMRAPHPLHAPHSAIAHRTADAYLRRLCALRRTAAQWLLLLAMLADLVAVPAWSPGVPSMDTRSMHARSSDAQFAGMHCADSTPFAAADECGDPLPYLPDLVDSASLVGEHAECEPGLLPPPLRTPAPAIRSAALPDFAQAARTRPHGPDPRPPLA
ncbi:hypothetical protein [Lysobacter enzymogenes]|uniref:hypothetical protein n=1 Tax=Lysobacter enzymogenes TaxID=69 RepID=UPI001AF093E4|nr:hypothetical protein [Lysobacter enzymogenes]QQQ03321.1 hypothetical protein JHW41_10385 [Lysobacter enzymogenes]